MDFFSIKKAKRALHRSDLTLDEVALNYQTRRPHSKTLADGIAEMMAPSRVSPVKPMSVMGNFAARMFSASPLGDD